MRVPQGGGRRHRPIPPRGEDLPIEATAFRAWMGVRDCRQLAVATDRGLLSGNRIT